MFFNKTTNMYPYELKQAFKFDTCDYDISRARHFNIFNTFINSSVWKVTIEVLYNLSTNLLHKILQTYY